MESSSIASGPIAAALASCVWLRVLRGVLAFVCAADIVLGLLILFIPQLLFRLFDIPPPEDFLWFQLIGMMLIPGAVDGLVGFAFSEQYRSNVLVSCGSRFATAGFLLVVASIKPVPWILIVIALGEGLVGCLTVYYLWRVVYRQAGAGALGQQNPG